MKLSKGADVGDSIARNTFHENSPTKGTVLFLSYSFAITPWYIYNGNTPRQRGSILPGLLYALWSYSRLCYSTPWTSTTLPGPLQCSLVLPTLTAPLQPYLALTNHPWHSRILLDIFSTFRPPSILPGLLQ